MRDWIPLLVAIWLVARASRALARRIALPIATSPIEAQVAWVDIESGASLEEGSREGRPSRFDAAGEECWILFTKAGVEIAPSAIAGALALARERGSALVTAPPLRLGGSGFWRGVDLCLALWSGEGIDRVEIEAGQSRFAVGWDEFLMIRRDAYRRVGGDSVFEGAAVRARAIVRAAMRAGLKVTVTSVGNQVRCPASGPLETFERGLARYHEAFGRGRVSALSTAGLVCWVGLDPFLRVLEALLLPSGPQMPGTGPWVAVTTCGLLFAHRLLFHGLVDAPIGSIWLHPLAACVTSAAASLAAFQRVLGLGHRFERIREPSPPDHSKGVDYRAVYTERYFDGVDSRFSPWGFRDEDRYYGALLEPLLKHARGGRALDVGCGYGFLTRRLAAHYAVEGLDVSEAALSRARAAHPDIRFWVHEVEQPFPMAPGSYDVVTLTDVIEHLNDPDRLLQNLRAVLRVGGVLYVTTPNLNWIRRALYADADRREHHVSLMSRTSLLDSLARSGFRVEESWTYVSAYLIRRRFRSDVGPETGVIARKIESP